ncbi:MAG: TonB-dependent receptor [Proteobacteria bacterium]|nr:TonB-dependent receptor [Pseudomonadota bacterium]MBU1687675.1 TonB-dependent receptor [Pseudomonadota bacterium]
MKKLFFLVLVALSLLFLLMPHSAGAENRNLRTELTMAAGFSSGEFDWNIAGDLNGENPKILSELSWTDLSILQVGAQGRMILKKDHWKLGGVARGRLVYGAIVAGQNQDSDYDGDNRTREFSRSNNLSDSGGVWDVTLGVGPVFFLKGETFTISPLAGFSYHSQDLRMNDGYQTISEGGYAPAGYVQQPVGPFHGLDSSYLAEWEGGWLGCDLEYISSDSLKVYGGVEVHLVHYHAEADWNLRPDLNHPVSFIQESDEAIGFREIVGVSLGEGRLRVKLEFNYERWHAQNGKDTVYFTDGSRAVTRLNEANWESLGGELGLILLF